MRAKRRRRPFEAAVVAPLLACLSLAQPARAAADETVHPWQRVGAGLERAYGWPNTLFHLGAAASTPPLALWVDEPLQESLQRHDPVEPLGPAALYFGGIAPIVVPAALYLGGLAAEHGELATAGAAAVQAVVVETVIVHALKWLTDRAGPYPDGDPSQRRWSSSFLRDSTSATDFDFDPFSLDGGLRWPSGHTASTVAMVSALVAFHPDQTWLALVGYSIALATAVGMLEGDYHWLSDVVAGALIGHVVGWQVGREFRETYDARNAPRRDARAQARRPSWTPTAAPLGLRMSGAW